MSSLHFRPSCVARGLRALTLGLAVLALGVPAALAGSDVPTASGPSAGSGAGNFSAGDETVGTLPSVHEDNRWPEWLRPGDHLVLLGDAQAIASALSGVRGQGTLHFDVLEGGNGDQLRVVLAGSWSLSVRQADLASGALRVAFEVVEEATPAVASALSPRGPRSQGGLVLAAGELALPVGTSSFSLHTANSLGVRTHLHAAAPSAGRVALDLRTN